MGTLARQGGPIFWSVPNPGHLLECGARCGQSTRRDSARPAPKRRLLVKLVRCAPLGAVEGACALLAAWAEHCQQEPKYPFFPRAAAPPASHARVPAKVGAPRASGGACCATRGSGALPRGAAAACQAADLEILDISALFPTNIFRVKKVVPFFGG